MKELDEIDQLFQTTFEGFELTPDPSVKQNIDHAIASKKKRRRFLFILFPALFGIAVLATALLFYPKSGQNILAQNQVQETQTNRKNQEAQGVREISNSDNNQDQISYGAADIGREIQKSHKTRFNQSLTFKKPASDHDQERNFNPDVNSTTSPDQTGRLEKLQPEIAANLLVEATAPAPEAVQTDTIKNTSDSLTANTSADSLKTADLTTLADEPGLLPEVKKAHTKWSMSLLTGWESESKKPAPHFDSLDLSMDSKESARIQSTSFYGKAEFNRRINARMDAIMGLGFHSRRITHYGSLYSLDSFPLFEGVGSAPPTDTFEYFIRKQSDSRTYQVNSIIMPLGVAYSAPIGKAFRLRISGGAELTYSWMKEKQPAPVLTFPEFHSFGMNAWIRPEIHYTFGKFDLFGFGTFNQPLIRQLKWDFRVPRNPAFGAGIGVLIQL